MVMGDDLWEFSGMVVFREIPESCSMVVLDGWR